MQHYKPLYTKCGERKVWRVTIEGKERDKINVLHKDSEPSF